ncbi:hypothetical protein SAMN04487866_11423 [Thermoactinomyces sp. DSM 45891]|uniref:hypothetical protein n=1 Tax=Thermoactinomyces sp. DSM 45891 TaxID=1761907 RepID=UPI00091C0154|nr:hypothetical protein [Thermoactinomyces sp. DSM 45891]SFX62045.1 hypothetical protein SAMN04487866_11423 [Thermoactinomyces sp. DSM 45891]
MVEIQVTGPKEEVQSVVSELYRSPSLEVLKEESGCKIEDANVRNSVKCFVNYLPDKRTSLVQIIKTDEQKVDFKMFDMVEAVEFKGIKVYRGREVDIFSLIQEEKEGFLLWMKLKKIFDKQT